MIISINPVKIYQGTCLVVDLSITEKPSSIRGNFLGKNFYFINSNRDPHSYKAWLAVPIETSPGGKDIFIRINYGKKYVNKISQIEVLKKDFPVEKINLPEEKTSLLIDKALAKETAIIGGCFKHRSQKKYFEGKFIMPVSGKITSAFGLRRIYIGSNASWPHKGIDIGGYGGEKIVASNKGKVILSSSMKAHGNTIIIDHGLGIMSIHCHLKKRMVKAGKFVNKGELIGILGKSGIATGENVHFGISVNDVRVDPVQFIKSDITL